MTERRELDNYGVRWPRESIGTVVAGDDGKTYRVVGLKNFGRILIVELHPPEDNSGDHS